MSAPEANETTRWYLEPPGPTREAAWLISASGAHAGFIYESSRDEFAALVRAAESGAVGTPLESRIEYGHRSDRFGWVNEPRGRDYATSQRIVHFRIDAPTGIAALAAVEGEAS